VHEKSLKVIKTLAPHLAMYRRSCPSQLSFENFYLPFGGKLSSDNRWVKLAKLIPWEAFEQTDADPFSQEMGAPDKSFRRALGRLTYQREMGDER
jgi:hypothetical protein